MAPAAGQARQAQEKVAAYKHLTPEQKAKLLAALDAKQAVVAEAAARAAAEALSGQEQQEQQQLGPQELRTEVRRAASSCSLAVLHPHKWLTSLNWSSHACIQLQRSPVFTDQAQAKPLLCMQVVEELMSITDGQVVLKQQRDPGE